MEYQVTILWGADPEPGDEAKTYHFATKTEMDAFLFGVSEMAGWHDYSFEAPGFVVPKGDAFSEWVDGRARQV